MHMADQPLPRIAAAFRDFMVNSGQALIETELETYYQKYQSLHRRGAKA
jgi:hypothetical protein